MFGWGDFKEDGKLREENRVKNNIFHCLAKEGKHRGRKIREKILSRAHNSHLPKSGGKLWGEKWTYGIFTQMPFPTYSHSFFFFSSSHPLLSCSMGVSSFEPAIYFINCSILYCIHLFFFSSFHFLCNFSFLSLLLIHTFFFFFLLDSKTFVHNTVQMGHLHPKAIGPV